MGEQRHISCNDHGDAHTTLGRQIAELSMRVRNLEDGAICAATEWSGRVGFTHGVASILLATGDFIRLSENGDPYILTERVHTGTGLGVIILKRWTK